MNTENYDKGGIDYVEQPTPPLYSVWELLQGLERNDDIYIFFFYDSVECKNKISQILTIEEFKEISKVYILNDICISAKTNNLDIQIVCKSSGLQIDFNRTSINYDSGHKGLSDFKLLISFMELSEQISKIYTNRN